MPHRTVNRQYLSIFVLISFVVLQFLCEFVSSSSASGNVQFVCRNSADCARTNSKHKKRSPVYVHPQNKATSSSYFNQTETLRRTLRQAFRTLPQSLLNENNYNYNGNVHNKATNKQYHQAQSYHYEPSKALPKQSVSNVQQSYHFVPESSPIVENVPFQRFPEENYLNNRDSSGYSNADQNVQTDADNRFSYDSTLNDIYPNGTNEVAETQVYTEYLPKDNDNVGEYEEVEGTQHNEYPHSSGLFSYYDGHGKYPKVDLGGSDVKLETSNAKFAVVIVGLWYM
jgi:hypothetical protein